MVDLLSVTWKVWEFFLTDDFFLLFSSWHAGVKKICSQLEVPFLGEIPLHASICADADVGKPTMVASPDSPSAKAFMDVAEKVRAAIGI
jgi:MinD superfamily P-loop ATPase